MMSLDDDDVEPRLKAVENYYFVDDNDAPVSFDALPFQFDAAEEVPSFKKDVYLRGFTDGGLQKVYKQVVARKLGLDGRSPEITVLSTEGSWIVLLKLRPSYEETVQSVLITVEMVHFLRRRPTVSDPARSFDQFHRSRINHDFRNSFYLPDSLDMSDKQIDQWNASPPPLYLWSRSDWTEKHKKIAEEHGHTETLKVVSHAKEVDYIFDDLPTQNHGEVTHEQNSTSGKDKETHMDENMNFVTGKPEQVDRFPPEKQVEIAFEETKVALNKSDTCRADQSGVHREERCSF